MARSLEGMAGSPLRDGNHALTPVVRLGRLGEARGLERSGVDDGPVRGLAAGREVAQQILGAGVQ
jgi:hypothetical protein